jgi:two-component system response regulator MprA
MLSPHGGVTDIVKGLESGADDYIAKPFALAELLARVRAALRRTVTHEQSKEHSQMHPITVGNLTIEQAARQMWCGDTPLELTKLEYDLLEVLAQHPGQVLPIETILQRVWGYNHDVGREMVKAYVYTLRKKLNACCRANPIQTKRGRGYMLKPEVFPASCVPH